MTRILQRISQPHLQEKLQSAGVIPLMARLFASRGITEVLQLSPSLSNILPPSSLTHNTVMAKILADAIAAKKKILVIGDYDADGATATAVAIKGLRLFGANVDFLVPNRFKYGYGLTPEIVVLAALEGPDFIVTVDNGIASIDGVAMANSLGITVLITDHHLPGKETPFAACIVNPNQHDCTFSSKNLAGVGVMFYVLLALRAELRSRGVFTKMAEPNLTELLDLVALGTVADLVKLDDNNRILIEQGLRRIRSGVCSQGILALLRISGRQYQAANVQDLGFYVGPRLNAAGRLDDMSLGIQCLLTTSELEATKIAEQLQDLNSKRRSIEAVMQEDANVSLDNIEVVNQFAITIYQEDWHQGVIGILASRIKERFHRPAIVFADAGDGTLKGSGRSIASLHLRDALDLLSKYQPDLIVKFGGHSMAAGLTIDKVNYERFSKSFEIIVKSLVSEADLDSVIEVDGSLSAEDMIFKNAQILENQVWGQGFPPPMFYDTFEVLSQRILAEKHLKLSLKNASVIVDAIFFNHTDLLERHVNAVYQLQTNNYNGSQKIQLNIRFVSA